MASIVKEITIDAPAASVWAAVRDFGNVHNLVPALLAGCQLDGDARVVSFLGTDAVAREVLVSLDDGSRRLVYAEPDGPFIHRNASCQVFALDENHSTFVWTQDFLPDEFTDLISGNMDKALPDLKRALEKND